MAKRPEQPPPLSPRAERARRNRVFRIAQRLGFVGDVDYVHSYSSSGGAQYVQRRKEADDLLVVYAEAFDRDADPRDFSLEAILAHERGHQIVTRDSTISSRVRRDPVLWNEETLASIVGSILCAGAADRINLSAKAHVDLVVGGVQPAIADRQIKAIRTFLERHL